MSEIASKPEKKGESFSDDALKNENKRPWVSSTSGLFFLNKKANTTNKVVIKGKTKSAIGCVDLKKRMSMYVWVKDAVAKLPQTFLCNCSKHILLFLAQIIQLC